MSTAEPCPTRVPVFRIRPTIGVRGTRGFLRAKESSLCTVEQYVTCGCLSAHVGSWFCDKGFEGPEACRYYLGEVTGVYAVAVSRLDVGSKESISQRATHFAEKGCGGGSPHHQDPSCTRPPNATIPAGSEGLATTDPLTFTPRGPKKSRAKSAVPKTNQDSRQKRAQKRNAVQYRTKHAPSTSTTTAAPTCQTTPALATPWTRITGAPAPRQRPARSEGVSPCPSPRPSPASRPRLPIEIPRLACAPRRIAATRRLLGAHPLPFHRTRGGGQQRQRHACGCSYFGDGIQINSLTRSGDVGNITIDGRAI